jgi:hypothetical protein
MQDTSIELNGTLRPDGTLVLDERPNLPAGRVRVRVESVPHATAAAEGFWTRMQAIWAAQEARGHTPRSVEEIEAERKALRDDSEEEIRAALRIYEESERARGQSAKSSEQRG